MDAAHSMGAAYDALFGTSANREVVYFDRSALANLARMVRNIAFVIVPSGEKVTPSTATVEKGSRYAFTAHVTGQNNPQQSVVWSVSDGVNGTSIDENGVLTVSDSETADTITVTATSVYDSSKSGTAVVTVPQVLTVVKPQTPTITSNPQSVTVYVGDKVSLSVDASVTDGGALSYQWYRNNVNSNAGGSLIEGAISPSYTPPTGTAGATYYYVIVTNTVVGAARSVDCFDL